MPRPEDRKRTNQRDDGNWSGYREQNKQNSWRSEFVNVPVSAQDTEYIKAWCVTAEEMSQLCDKLCEEDYKIDVRWDKKFRCFSCILYPVGEEHPNAGLLLSGRASTALKALRQVAYKHYRLCDSVWGSWTDKRDPYEIDD